MTAFPDDAASDYDERILRLVPGYACAIELMGSVLAARMAGPARILVPGCGTGAEVLALARALPEARFSAVDPSRGMISAARSKLRQAGIEERVSLVQGQLADLPKDSHDAATLSLVLHFLPDGGAKAALLGEIADRLADDAPLLLLDPASGEADDADLACWLRAQGHDDGAIATVLGRMKSQWHRMTAARMDRLLAEAGFGGARTFFRAFGFRGIVAGPRPTQ